MDLCLSTKMMCGKTLLFFPTSQTMATTGRYLFQLHRIFVELTLLDTHQAPALSPNTVAMVTGMGRRPLRIAHLAMLPP